METNFNQPATAGAAPVRDGSITIRCLADAYMAQYAGRDPSRGRQLAWWVQRLGERALRDVVDDDVHEAIEALEARHGRYYAGVDAEGEPVMRAKKKPLAASTLNSYQATLSALLSWAQRRRLTPRGWANPCHAVPLHKVNNAIVRFLSDAERTALLAECRRSKWPKLYLLVLLSLTTGARRGELEALRWRDVDLDAAIASVARTKNTDRKMLPLTPAVVKELRRFEAAPGSLVFASKQRPDQHLNFQQPWVRALRNAGIRRFRFHDLRHSCASALAQNGATLVEIAEVLGHRQLQVTYRYIHLCTGHKSKLINRVLGDLE